VTRLFYQDSHFHFVQWSQLNYILNEHPPLHVPAFDPKAFWRDSVKEIDKKTILKLLKVYHTDKVDRKKFSHEYFFIVEEIAKCLVEAIDKLNKLN